MNNSIIFIDEIEISLHPELQQKLIKIYENIGDLDEDIMLINLEKSRRKRKHKKTMLKVNKDLEPDFLFEFKRKNNPKTWDDYNNGEIISMYKDEDDVRKKEQSIQ